MYIATIGAGVLLGGLVVTCFGMRRAQLQVVLTGAVVAGLLTAEPVAKFRDFTSMPRRYADCVPVDTQPVNAVWLVLAAITLVAGVSMWGVGRGDDASVDERRGSARELLIGVGLPLVPVATAYTIVASLPSTTTVTATALALPAVMVLPLVAQFGWTDYTPLMQDSDRWLPSSWTWMSSAVSVIAVLALGAAMAWLQYRRPDGVTRRGDVSRTG